MKFRASFSDVGVGWLEKRFLPAFEKLSSAEVTVLLTPDSVHFIHDAKALGGAEVHADFLARERLGVLRPSALTPLAQVAELFDPDTYKLQSAHGNKLAFRLDAAMFRRVLAGLAVSDAAR